MIYIVIYHSLCYYGVWSGDMGADFRYPYLWQIIYLSRFSLIAFVFISGFLYAKIYQTGRYSDTGTVIKKKLNRILLPYLGWGLLLVMIFPDIYSLWDLSYGISHLWFLSVLVILFAFIILLRQYVLNKYIIGLLLVLSIIESYNYIFYYRIPPYFTLRETIIYLPAFLWGILCVSCQLPEKINRWHKAVFYPVLIFLTLFTALNFYYDHLPYNKYYFKIVQYLLLLFGYTFLKYKIHFESVHPALNHLDTHSLGIYIIHHIIIWAVILYIPPVKPFMNHHYILAPIILFTVVFFLSWGLSALMHRNRFLRAMLGA